MANPPHLSLVETLDQQVHLGHALFCDLDGFEEQFLQQFPTRLIRYFVLFAILLVGDPSLQTKVAE